MIDVVIIGAGQSGLAIGYQLQRRGVPFVILDGSDRVGDKWRSRWDSLRLFTTRRYDALDGLPFPGDQDGYPDKDEMADYLETYARTFDLPLRLGTRVDRLCRVDGRYRVVVEGGEVIEAASVVVAMSSLQHGGSPALAAGLDDAIVSMHSSEYRRSADLPSGPVIVVGAGNSGVEIALDLAATHEVTLAGPFPFEVPFDIESTIGRKYITRLVNGFYFHRVLTVRTPIGRRARPKILGHGGHPLVRSGAKDIAAAGITHTDSKVMAIVDGKPQTADGTIHDVATVIWATGYRPGLEWIEIDVFEHGMPRHEAGVCPDSPGLYFIGQAFLYSFSSHQVQGVSRDARRLAAYIAERQKRLVGAG